MEAPVAVLGESPVGDYAARLCFVEAERIRDMVIIIFHSMTPHHNGRFSVHMKLLELRRSFFFHKVEIALSKYEDVGEALKNAFIWMNWELETQPHDSLKRWEWSAENNSLVVVLGNGYVHLLGDASAQVNLFRDGFEMSLTRMRNEYCLNLPAGTHPFYYNKKQLSEKDSYLLVGANHLFCHMEDCGDSASVFLSRIEAFGLEEACRQVAGTYQDSCKSFVIVPVNAVPNVCHLAHKCVDSKPVPGFELVRTCDEFYNSDIELEDSGEERELRLWREKAYKLTRPPGLYPLFGDGPQHPEPVTACRPHLPRSEPSIRILSLEVGELKLTCKVGKSQLVIEKQDFHEHFANVLSHPRCCPYEEAPAIACPDGLLLYFEMPQDCGKAVSFASSMQFKRVVFLVSSSVRDVEHVKSVVKALRSCGETSEGIEVNFIVGSKEEWRSWSAATDQLAFQNYQGFVDYQSMWCIKE